jgi:hypothetical protein
VKFVQPWNVPVLSSGGRLAVMLRRDRPYARVVVPDHKELRSGTLRRIIADAGFTVDQFIELLRR